MNPEKRVVIIGAGISGLCVAYWLKKAGVNVFVFEKDADVGGTMKTFRQEGWLVETGPNSALETTPLFQELFESLGITEKRVDAHPQASRRYVLRDGKLHALPLDPVSFLKSRLWTWRGKLRLFKEPFIGRADTEESVADFVRRRLGEEFLDYTINPFVAGVFAGEPERLSVRAAFPKLYALEDRYGGLVKGMILGRKERKKRAEKAKSRANMFSFLEGMQTLPSSLAMNLRDCITVNSPVEHIVPQRAGRYPVYAVYGAGTRPITSQAAAVVLSTPAYVTANIIRPIDPEMARTLESIFYPPVGEVFMGFRKEQIRRPLDGFGFLVPEKERRSILGTIWSSALFPHRAPVGCVALTSFVGGSRQPDLVAEEDSRLAKLVLADLQQIMGIDGSPIYTKIIRWPKAIPQYTLGYDKALKAMDRFEENFPGAFLCSNYRGGISVGDCVMSAEKTVKRVLDHLKLL